MEKHMGRLVGWGGISDRMSFQNHQELQHKQCATGHHLEKRPSKFKRKENNLAFNLQWKFRWSLKVTCLKLTIVWSTPLCGVFDSKSSRAVPLWVHRQLPTVDEFWFLLVNMLLLFSLSLHFILATISWAGLGLCYLHVMRKMKASDVPNVIQIVNGRGCPTCPVSWLNFLSISLFGLAALEITESVDTCKRRKSTYNMVYIRN